MGVVLMSKRELNRIDVLARLDGRRLTTLAAAELMRVSLRQTHRLLKRYRDGGAPAIANRRRGRPSNNRLSNVVRDHAVALVRERYADFGPTFAAEKLGERHDVHVSRETLRGWMRQAGIWLPRGGAQAAGERPGPASADGGQERSRRHPVLARTAFCLATARGQLQPHEVDAAAR
jgi:transposase